MSATQPLCVGIAGVGAIGGRILQALRTMPQYRVAGVAGESVPLAMEALDQVGERLDLAMEIDELVSASDIVVEAAPASAFLSIARPVLGRGRTLVALSGAGLLEAYEAVSALLSQSGRLVLASGAIGGLDAVKALACDKVEACKLISTKPVAALATAPYVTQRSIRLDQLAARSLVFAGDAGEAARAFPANANVAAALALAGPGPARVAVEIWADPAIDFNMHEVSCRGELGEFTAVIRARPDPANPRTSRLAAASVIAALRDIGGPIRIGT